MSMFVNDANEVTFYPEGLEGHGEDPTRGEDLDVFRDDVKDVNAFGKDTNDVTQWPYTGMVWMRSETWQTSPQALYGHGEDVLDVISNGLRRGGYRRCVRRCSA